MPESVNRLYGKQDGPESKSTEVHVVDVRADAYYDDAVLLAVEKGMTTGTGDTTFSPDATCTCGQILTFLYRCLGDE